MTPTDPHKEYIASRVLAATPMELTRMLFEGALQSVQEAMAAHRAGDILARGNAVTKAVQILGELRFSLRRDVAPQYCDTLSSLYGYMQSQLIQAHAQKSESMLQEVAQLIQTLLDGWIGAMRNVSAQNAVAEDARPATSEVIEILSAPNPYSSKETPVQSLPRSWEF